jgi:hypothetical protein
MHRRQKPSDVDYEFTVQLSNLLACQEGRCSVVFEDFFSHSQNFLTGSYRDPDDSNPQTYILFLYPSVYALVSQAETLCSIS